MAARKAATRTRKKTIEPEILPPDEELDETEQTEETDEPMVRQQNTFIREVPLSQALGISDDDDENEYEPEAKKKKSIRQKIKERIAKGKNTNPNSLDFKVERLTNFEQDGELGLTVDRKIAFRKKCTVEYIEREDYINDLMIRARKGGDFVCTVRDSIGVLDIFDVHIDRQDDPQPIIETDPVTGRTTIINQMPSQNGSTLQAEQVKVPTHKEMLKDMVETIELTDRLRGKSEPSSPPAPAAFDVQAFAAQVIQTKEVMGALVQGISGSKREGKKDLVELLFEHGPTLVREIAAGVKEVIIEVRQGKAEEQAARRIPPRRIVPRNQTAPSQGQSQASGGASHGSETGVEGEEGRGDGEKEGQGEQVVTPEVALLNYLINAYLNHTPVTVVMGYLEGKAEEDESLIPLLGSFAKTSVDVLLSWIGMLRPDLKGEIGKPETSAWIKSLQQAIDEAWQVDEEEGEGE